MSVSRRLALLATAGGIAALAGACSSKGAIDAGPAGEVVATRADLDTPLVTKTANGTDIVIVATSDGPRAFSAVCPHAGCVVRPKDDVLDCPCHGSWFDPATGAVARGPARENLTEIPVTTAGDDIVLQ
ncbi:MAG: Rieske (2Fe-2S) protein [Bowdeniella nasicola]|nr:Rieske (2Fe-2S) protein [Bowdeniella nasicola]